jgi:hypothetical protein
MSIALLLTDGFSSPPKEVMLQIFIVFIYPLPSAGFEPTNLECNGKHATTTPLMVTKFSVGVNTSFMQVNEHLIFCVYDQCV